jgi:competence protein ComEC
MLDVGQGDGIYLQDGMGGNYFIDGGSTSDSSVGTRVILPFFKYRGIQAIDNWYVTHPDLDHISGLIEVLDSGYDVKRITVAKYIVRNDNFTQLIEAAENNGTEVFVADVGDTWKDE